MKNPFNMTRNDFLHSLGLQTRRSTVGYVLLPIGMFGIGVLAGAGIGLLFAPRSGREIRRDLGTRVNEMTTKLKSKVRHASSEVSSSLDDARDSLYGGSDYSASSDLGGMDTGRRTGLTNSTT